MTAIVTVSYIFFIFNTSIESYRRKRLGIIFFYMRETRSQAPNVEDCLLVHTSTVK